MATQEDYQLAAAKLVLASPRLAGGVARTDYNERYGDDRMLRALGLPAGLASFERLKAQLPDSAKNISGEHLSYRDAVELLCKLLSRAHAE